MEESQSFVPLLIVFLLAFAVPLVLARFKKLNLPIVVGELIAGILIGRSGFGWVEHSDPVLELLAEFGFVFLMFLSGMEIDFTNLGLLNGNGKNNTNGPKQKWGPVQLGVTSFGLTLALSALVGFAFYRFELVRNPWMMALILSTTSLGVIVPVLKEKGISSGSYGQSILVAGLIADFVTMFLITVLVAVLSRGLTLDILLIGVLFVAFFLFYRFGDFFFNRLGVVRRTINELSGATAQIKVRAAFTIMLVFVALSESIGTEVILGAFLAGAIISLLKRPEDSDLEHQLTSIGFGFFIPIFFIMVGVDFNLSALADSPQAMLLAALLVLSALLVKLIPALLFKLAFSWREAFGAGAILSARLSLIIAASAIGLRLGIISEAVNSAIVLVSLITVSIAPVVFNKLIPSPEDEQKKLVIVAGAGELGIQVAEMLHKLREEVLVLAKNKEQQQRVERRGLQVIIADAGKTNSKLEPYFEQAKAVVCVYSDTKKALKVSKRARLVYGIDHVVARVDNPQDIPPFEKIGVMPMNLAMDRAALLVILTRNPSLYTLLIRTDDDKDVREITVGNESITGKRIRDLTLPGDLLILALERAGELITPNGNTQIEFGDRLSVMGEIVCIEEAETIFQ